MVQLRQADISADPLVARFSLRRILPHAVLSWASIALSAALLVSNDRTRTFALGVLLLASLILVVGIGLMVRKVNLVVDHQGIEWPGGSFVVPWTDVVSLALDRGSLLRVEVRDGRGLLARQSPELSIWRGRRRRLADSGIFVFYAGGLDRPPKEIFDAAMTRLKAASH